jgi:heme/copper-type cytochrome/quinol oxidase subunit 2
LNNCPEGFVTELQSEDNSVFASVDVTNGSPATVDGAAAPSPAANMSTTANISPDMAVSGVLAVIIAVPVLSSCFYFLIRYLNDKKKKKTEETSKTITVDVELQSNPMKH